MEENPVDDLVTSPSLTPSSFHHGSNNAPDVISPENSLSGRNPSLPTENGSDGIDPQPMDPDVESDNSEMWRFFGIGTPTPPTYAEAVEDYFSDLALSQDSNGDSNDEDEAVKQERLLRVQRNYFDKVKPHLVSDAKRSDVAYDEIIRGIFREEELAQLDFYKDQKVLKELVKEEVVDLKQAQSYLIDRMKIDLEVTCFCNHYHQSAQAGQSASGIQAAGGRFGDLNPEVFKQWYSLYREAVFQLCRELIRSYIQHHRSGLLINPDSGTYFSAEQIQEYITEVWAMAKRALSLTDGPFHFEIEKKPDQTWSEATGGVLLDDGRINFKSKHWNPEQSLSTVTTPVAGNKQSDLATESLDPEDAGPTSKVIDIGNLLNRSKLRIDESIMTEGFLELEPDRTELCPIQGMLDGKRHDLAELLSAEREQLAKRVEESNPETDVLAETLKKTIRLLQQKYDSGFAYDPTVPNKEVQRLLKAYIESEDYKKASSDADRIRALPLNYIYDICSARNIKQHFEGDPNWRPTFIRFQKMNHYLPIDVFCSTIGLKKRQGDREVNIDGFTEMRDAVIMHINGYYTTVVQSVLPVGEYWPQARSQLLRLQEVCRNNHAEAVLFIRRPDACLIQIVLRLTCSAFFRLSEKSATGHLSYHNFNSAQETKSRVDGKSRKTVMHFNRNKSNGEVQFDPEASHLNDMLLKIDYVAAQGGGYDSGFYSVDVNPRLPFMPGLSSAFPRRLPGSYYQNLPVNGVLGPRLHAECYKRTISGYLRNRQHVFANDSSWE